MKLLIVTQVVDIEHSNLGFFHEWIRAFAAHCELVTVVCLEKGAHSLPSNVRVMSLGKESGVSRMVKIARLYRYVWSARTEYDAVFVHMNPEYVILAGWLWRLWRKPLALWYVHKHVGLRLRAAVWLVDVVFTTTPESFRLPSPKVYCVGHGIPKEAFITRLSAAQSLKRILMVGRMSRAKGIDVGLVVLEKLDKGYTLTIVGGTHTADDRAYAAEINSLIDSKQLGDRVQVVGAVSSADVRKYYAQADVFLHTSTTGSTDKVVLEALAAGLPVVSTGDAFRSTPGVSYVVPGDVGVLAQKVRDVASGGGFSNGVDYVRESHGLETLVIRIVGILKGRML